MKDNYGIKELLLKMNNNTENNLKEILKVFKSFDYIDAEDERSILHILVDQKHDEAKCLLAIESLLDSGVDVNKEDYYGGNFIQTALCTGYSESFIIKAISLGLKYGLDVNNVDMTKCTIMHTAIYSNEYKGNLNNILVLLSQNGFDFNKKDSDGNGLIEAMKLDNEKYSPEQIRGLEKTIKSMYRKRLIRKREELLKNKNVNISKKYKITDEDFKILNTNGIILNDKDYKFSPAIGRDFELKKTIYTLAQDKKNPILVGESGVGKTSIVDELVYRIKNNNINDFLMGQIIYELNTGVMSSGKGLRGEFEDKIIKVLDICIRHNIIVFIDEIHEIYGVGTSVDKNLDMADIIKNYIDRRGLKVIGTTTEEEYKEYFSKDALKRRFEKIIVKEPTRDILYSIIMKVISDYEIKKERYLDSEELKKEITNVLIETTNNKSRSYFDKINNPDLAISIIDKAFAIAVVDNKDNITVDNFIDSVKYNDRLSKPSQEKIIRNLETLKEPLQISEKPKILKIDFKNKSVIR